MPFEERCQLIDYQEPFWLLFICKSNFDTPGDTSGSDTNRFSRGVQPIFRDHRRSQYEANRGTRLGKILPNTVDFYFFYQTDNIRRFHTVDFVQRTVCSPRL